MTIYLDVLFIKEFLINFAIIYSTNKILQQKSKLLLIFLGCIVGASYTLLCLTFPGKYIYIGRIICVALIVFVTSNSQTIQNYLKSHLKNYVSF